MKRDDDDVHPVLEQAAGRLPVPDLADVAWSRGLDIRRRRRRGTATLAAVILICGVVSALLAGVGGGSAEPVPPSVPPSGLVTPLPPAGQIAGTEFWLAPPAGSEPYLDRIATPLGELLRLPDDPADLRVRPVHQIAAIVLSQQDSGHYRPLLLDGDGHWAEAKVDLLAVRVGAAGFGPPLSPASVSPDGRLAAFAQPGAMVLLDGATGDVRRFELPSEDLRSVGWLPDSERVLVSGVNVAYRVLVGPGGSGEQPVAVVPGSRDPASVTAPYRLEADAGHLSLMRYGVSGGWSVQSRTQLPTTGWYGQTFTSVSWAARVFQAAQLPEVSSTTPPPQVVAAISTVEKVPSRLLVLTRTSSRTAGQTTPQVRAPGCCSVLGWYDDRTVLLQVNGDRSGWILGWELTTGTIRRVTELEVTSIALGPGIHG
jgi:hypothetical protein